MLGTLVRIWSGMCMQCMAAVLQCSPPADNHQSGDTGRALAAGSCLLSVTGDATQAGTLCIIVQLAAITVRATIIVTIRD